MRAQFIETSKNRIMYITYKFNGFREIKRNKDVIMLEADMSYERNIPEYIKLVYEK